MMMAFFSFFHSFVIVRWRCEALCAYVRLCSLMLLFSLIFFFFVVVYWKCANKNATKRKFRVLTPFDWSHSFLSIFFLAQRKLMKIHWCLWCDCMNILSLLIDIFSWILDINTIKFVLRWWTFEKVIIGISKRLHRFPFGLPFFVIFVSPVFLSVCVRYCGFSFFLSFVFLSWKKLLFQLIYVVTLVRFLFIETKYGANKAETTEFNWIVWIKNVSSLRLMDFLSFSLVLKWNVQQNPLAINHLTDLIIPI